MTSSSSRNLKLFSKNNEDSRQLGEILRSETSGGLLLILATAAALIWANSPVGESYFSLRNTVLPVDIGVIHLKLSIGAWASDGLLTLFFFLAGLELKRELLVGELRTFSRAVVPITAAFGGVIVPALIYILINLGNPELLRGWAIPTATDIAVALAVLAIIGSHLPTALRVFLLTLAIVDDLIAITIIAVSYPDHLQPQYLFYAAIPLALFALCTRYFPRAWYILIPLAIATWFLIHESGVHATVAGVLLAFVVPVKPGKKHQEDLAERYEHALRPLSSGFAVPVFAFFSSGVAIGGLAGFADSIRDPIAIGIILALVLGKTIGVFGSTFLLTRFTRAKLDDGLAWIDLFGLAILTGIGFTVSLLISELAFGRDSAQTDHAKVAILTASLLAGVLASIILGARNRHYRKLEAEDPQVHPHDD